MDPILDTLASCCNGVRNGVKRANLARPKLSKRRSSGTSPSEKVGSDSESNEEVEQVLYQQAARHFRIDDGMAFTVAQYRRCVSSPVFLVRKLRPRLSLRELLLAHHSPTSPVHYFEPQRVVPQDA